MKYIKLTKGKFAMVDDEDFEWLSQWKWLCLSGRPARAITVGKYGKRGYQKFIRMYNIIMNPPKGYEVDHINHDPLDNRRSNLRICTPLENQANKRVSSKSKSGYRGVYPSSNGYKKWRVFIDMKLVGYYDDAKEAARAYNEAAKKKYGKFSPINIL